MVSVDVHGLYKPTCSPLPRAPAPETQRRVNYGVGHEHLTRELGKGLVDVGGATGFQGTFFAMGRG